MNRKNYPDSRKYKHIQLKTLISSIELNFKTLCSNRKILTVKEHNQILNDTKDMFFEIALRLD